MLLGLSYFCGGKGGVHRRSSSSGSCQEKTVRDVSKSGTMTASECSVKKQQEGQTRPCALLVFRFFPIAELEQRSSDSFRDVYLNLVQEISECPMMPIGQRTPTAPIERSRKVRVTIAGSLFQNDSKFKQNYLLEVTR